MTDTSAREAARRALQESLDRRDNGGPAALLGATAPAHTDSAPTDTAPPAMRTRVRETGGQAAVPQPSTPGGGTTGGSATERRRYGTDVAAVA